jgi:hypothetical protein
MKRLKLDEPIVTSPAPPNPVSALMQMRKIISLAAPQPRQPRENVTVDTKKQILRPKISERRPYSGRKAVLVTRYEVVNHEAMLAAPNCELITAYVEAVMVMSKPFKKTLAIMAACIQKKNLGGTHDSASGARRSGWSSMGLCVSVGSSSSSILSGVAILCLEILWR